MRVAPSTDVYSKLKPYKGNFFFIAVFFVVAVAVFFFFFFFFFYFNSNKNTINLSYIRVAFLLLFFLP